MSEVLDRPREGKLVTMHYDDALGKVQHVTEMLLRCRDAARAMGSDEIADKCSLAKGELEQLIEHLTFSE